MTLRAVGSPGKVKSLRIVVKVVLATHCYYSDISIVDRIYFFLVLGGNSPHPPPPVGQGLLIHNVSISHTTTHHRR